MNKQQIAKMAESSQYSESLTTLKVGQALLKKKKKKKKKRPQYLKFVLKPELNNFLMTFMQKEIYYSANSVSIGLTQSKIIYNQKLVW